MADEVGSSVCCFPSPPRPSLRCKLPAPHCQLAAHCLHGTALCLLEAFQAGVNQAAAPLHRIHAALPGDRPLTDAQSNHYYWAVKERPVNIFGLKSSLEIII